MLTCGARSVRRMPERGRNMNIHWHPLAFIRIGGLFRALQGLWPPRRPADGGVFDDLPGLNQNIINHWLLSASDACCDAIARFWRQRKRLISEAIQT